MTNKFKVKNTENLISVGLENRLQARQPEFVRSPKGQALSSTVSRLALGPTQHSFRWVPWTLANE
jgi:hypothetical protein